MPLASVSTFVVAPGESIERFDVVAWGEDGKIRKAVQTDRAPFTIPPGAVIDLDAGVLRIPRERFSLLGCWP